MLARHAYYRAMPLADPRTHLVPIEAIHVLTNNPEALPTALDGRHCLIEITIVQGTHILAQLPPHVVLPAGDEIRCPHDTFRNYPDKLPTGAFLLVKMVLLDGR